jgi:radial spoke head protein 9
MFSGVPDHILIKNEPEKPAEEEGQPPAEAQPPAEKDPLASTSEDDKDAKVVPRNFTELDRLQLTVYAIENDCHIMPKGGIKLTDQHEVRRDNAFRGLDMPAACHLENYCHFRAVQDHLKRDGLEKDECVFKKDFLDEACNQKVRGAVSAQRVSTKGNIAFLRNHVWPGYATYHVANTKTHGCFYFGEGQKNLDLAFQL